MYSCSQASGPGIQDSILSLDVNFLKRLQEDDCEFGMIMTHYIRGQFEVGCACSCDELAVQGGSQKLLAEVLLCPGPGEGLMTPLALVGGPGLAGCVIWSPCVVA